MRTKIENLLVRLEEGRRKNTKSVAWHIATEIAEAIGGTVYPDPQMTCRNPYPDWDRLEKDVRAAQDDRPVIVTRHVGAIEWLNNHGFDGDVIAHVASPDQIRGRVVIGALPFHLAADAARVGVISMPGLRPDQRGVDLTPAEMDAAGAVVEFYVVSRIQGFLR